MFSWFLFFCLDCCLSADCQAKFNEHRATQTHTGSQFSFKSLKTKNKTLQRKHCHKVSQNDTQEYSFWSADLQTTILPKTAGYLFIYCISIYSCVFNKPTNMEHRKNLWTCIAPLYERVKYIYLSINICKSVIQYIEVFEKDYTLF